MDTLTAQSRSERMARIRSKDTKPELAVRSIAHQMGYRFRLHRKDLPGRPDLVFPGLKKIVFVHGCFWHAHAPCKVANRPKSRQEFWDAKFARNQARDAANKAALEFCGWKVATIWECELKHPDRVTSRLRRFLGPRAPNGSHA